MPTGCISQDQVQRYRQDGFVVVEGMFDQHEIQLLGRAARDDRALDERSFTKSDGEGGRSRLSLWNHPGDTIYGMVARCESMVHSAELLLGGEVYHYHYHSKMIMKDPKVGGAWTWHQDYGYWYQYGVLFPLLCSAFIAIDSSTRENG
jgi:ectoine hydroxylase-related dioxygenase (phytanoyl-CoA dioxygenase family)